MRFNTKLFLAIFNDVDNGVCPHCAHTRNNIVGTVKKVISGNVAIYTCTKCGYEFRITREKCIELLNIICNDARRV